MPTDHEMESALKTAIKAGRILIRKQQAIVEHLQCWQPGEKWAKQYWALLYAQAEEAVMGMPEEVLAELVARRGYYKRDTDTEMN